MAVPVASVPHDSGHADGWGADGAASRRQWQRPIISYRTWRRLRPLGRDSRWPSMPLLRIAECVRVWSLMTWKRATDDWWQQQQQRLRQIIERDSAAAVAEPRDDDDVGAADDDELEAADDCGDVPLGHWALDRECNAGSGQWSCCWRQRQRRG